MTEFGNTPPASRAFAPVLYRALAVPLVLLAVILGALSWATHHLTGSVEAVDRTDRMIGETEDVLRMSTAMETSLREFLLTDKDDSLLAFRGGDEQIDSEYRDLDELVGTSEAAHRLKVIGESLTVWRKNAREMIRTRQAGKESVAYDVNPNGKRLMDLVRENCQGLIDMQTQLHNERVRRANLSSNIVFGSCIVLAVALLVVITSMTIRQVRSLDNVFQQTHLARLEAEEGAQRLRHAYRAGKMWSCMLDPRTLRIHRSEGALWQDLENEDLEAWYERIHPEDRGRVRELIQSVLAGRPDYEVSYRIAAHDNSYRWIHSRGSWVKQAGGAVISGVAMDFTEEKRKEESLHRMAHLLDQTYEPVVIRNFDDCILYWNAGAERLYGWNRSEAIGRRCHELLHTVFPQEREKIRAQVIESGHWQGELKQTTRSGDLLVVETRWVVSKGEGGRPDVILETDFDMTERKRAEQTLVRSEKLASVGRMAATIAHEINNPLAAAMNAVFLASMETQMSQEAQRNLEVAEAELERVAHIAKQTLGFYKESAKPISLRLPQLLDSLLELYGPKLRNKSIRVERRYRTATTVLGVEGEMRQVLSNLISNSIDAMPQKGTLQVRINGPFLLGGREMLRLTIADSGSGVNVNDLKHIFEPFFTTKDTIGTGLGLWVTRELIAKHEGTIRVRSRVGEGTVFNIWLPAERRQVQRFEAAG